MITVELYHDSNYTVFCDVTIDNKLYTDPMIDDFQGNMQNYSKIVVGSINELDNYTKTLVKNVIKKDIK